MKVRGGAETETLTIGRVVRVTVAQDPLESGVNPRLVFLLISWQNLAMQWAEELIRSNVGAVLTGAPAVAGTGVLFNGSLVADLKMTEQMSALTLLNRLESSLPLGADVETLDLRPSGSLTETAQKSSDIFTPDGGVVKTVKQVSSLIAVVGLVVGGFLLFNAIKGGGRANSK